MLRYELDKKNSWILVIDKEAIADDNRLRSHRPRDKSQNGIGTGRLRKKETVQSLATTKNLSSVRAKCAIRGLDD